MATENKKKYDEAWNVGERRGLRKSAEILFREMPRTEKLKLLTQLINSLPPQDKAYLSESL